MIEGVAALLAGENPRSSYVASLTDRGYKWLKYKHIESLKAYVLVHQLRPAVELFTRTDSPDEWIHSEMVGVEAVLPLQAARCELALRLIFENVEFDVVVGETEVES